jgi:RNA polymerase sigma-70 factor (ECF subfamily)
MQRGDRALRICAVAIDDETLFGRFRERGDVGALGELFDRTSASLLRVALHLTRDPAAAEDLVQATFLRAIEVRAQWDAGRPVLPWLCGLLHNRARHDRWQRGRAPDPQRVAAPRAEAPPPDAAVRAEFDAAVDAAIAELPELYRPVLRLYLAYGHAPAEVAHALERPAATVRSQLARGLALLRTLLPAGFAGGAALLLASGRGLAAVKQAVVANGAAAVAPVAAASSLAGITFGGIAMGKKLGVALGAFALACGGWSLLRAPASAAAPHADVGPPAPVAASAVPQRTGDASPASPSPARAAADVVDTATTGSLRIVCRYDDGDGPAWDVAVSVELGSVRDGAMLQRTLRADANGVAVADGLPPCTAYLAADRGGTATAAVEAGAVRDVDLRIPRGVLVRGRVVDENGAGVGGASVWLGARRNTLVDGTTVAATDAAGRFELRAVEPNRFLSATYAGRRSAAVTPVRGSPGDTVDVELVVRGRGATLTGRVLSPDGTPANGARVLVGWRDDRFGYSPLLHQQHSPPPATSTTADGTFAVHGLAPGSKQAVWVRGSGCCLWQRVIELPADADAHVDVQLQRGGAVEGRATLGDGSAAAGAWIGHRSTAWFPARGDFHLENYAPEWSQYAVQTGRDGRYRLDCVSPGHVLLRANVEQRETRGEVDVAEGGTATWDPVLADVVIRGRVVDERGEPLADVSIDAIPPRGQGNMAVATTGADGRFVCRRLSPVPHVLVLHGSSSLRTRPLATLFGITPGGEELEVRVPDAMRPSATIVGRALAADGSPPRDARVSFASPAVRWRPDADVDPTTGAFRLGPLPDGPWRVQLSVGKEAAVRRSAWSAPFEVLRGAMHDVGVLQMPATGSIALTAADADGAPLRDAIVLEESDGWSEMPWSGGVLVDGRARIADVAPGTYRIRLGGGGGRPTVYTPVTVAAGTETAVHVALPRGIAVELAVPPVSEPVPIHEHFEWRRDGERFQRYWNWWEGNGERTWKQTMLPGTWELIVTSETGKVATTRFVVADGDPPGRRIAIAMP